MSKEMYIFSIEPPKIEDLDDDFMDDLYVNDIYNISKQYRDILSKDINKRKQAYVLYMTHMYKGKPSKDTDHTVYYTLLLLFVLTLFVISVCAYFIKV